jgi:hypothetical protein
MAQIVFVHGIANEQEGADSLGREWREQLSSAVRLAGVGDIADRINRDRSLAGAIDSRMAFYGNLFLKPGAQGIGDEEMGAPEEKLAQEWVRNIAERASERSADDKEIADGAIAAAEGGEHPQGSGRVIGWAVRTLSKVGFFAHPVYGAAALVKTALKQVTRYLDDANIRVEAQSSVLKLIGPETKVIIAHSLGSVVAWEAIMLRPPKELNLFVTIGSPLGLESIVYPRLAPDRKYPEPAKKWVNYADRDDFIASNPKKIAKQFPSGGDRYVSDWTADNGAEPHNARFYLGKVEIGRSVAEALK